MFVPALIGCDRHALRIGRRLFFRHGMLSHVFADKQNRDILCKGLKEIGYEFSSPDGAFYLFVKVPGSDAELFCKKAMEKDLLVVPGDSFGCPGYVRLCYCVSYEQIEKCLPIFRSLL